MTYFKAVRLYSALANNGELRPLRRTSRDPIAARGRSTIMPEAAFLTLGMLNLPRPEMGRAYSEMLRQAQMLSYKNAFFVLAVMILLLSPLPLMMRLPPKKQKPAPEAMGH